MNGPDFCCCWTPATYTMAPRALVGQGTETRSAFCFDRCVTGRSTSCRWQRAADRRRLAVRAIAEPPVKTATGANGATATEDHSKLKESILQNLLLTGSSTHVEALDAKDIYRGVAQSVREKLVAAFNRTQEYWR